MKVGPTSTIRSSLDPGKTAGDLAKERNKLEVSRRIDQVPPAKNLTEKLSKNLVSRQTSQKQKNGLGELI